MKNKILIIGGYGKVGRIISEQLAVRFPHKVIVAGRNLKKAEALAKKLNHTVMPYALDINSLAEDSILANTKLVLMCINQKDTAFVALCIKNKVHYMDITASMDFITQVEALDEQAQQANTTVALSLGLAPGITNLLAQHAMNQLPKATLADIFILLGIGEKHGDAAYRWTFDHIHSTYEIRDKEKTVRLKSFSQPKTTHLLGKRTFYTFNFSDQHTLSKTLNTSEIRTRMAFDSRFLTQLIAFSRKLGLTRIFTNAKIQNLFIALFKKLPWGSAVFAVKVTVENQDKQTYHCSLTGEDEGKITAYVAIEMALHILQNNTPSGVQHIHQLIPDIPQFLDHLKHYNPNLEIEVK